MFIFLKKVRSQRFFILKVNWVGSEFFSRVPDKKEIAQLFWTKCECGSYSKKISWRGKSEVNLFNPTSKFTHIKFRAIDWRHSTPSGLSVRGNACALHLNSRVITADYQCKQQASLLGDNTAEGPVFTLAKWDDRGGTRCPCVVLPRPSVTKLR